ncbi:hypothetical protein BT93_L1066 [Corymbia citriodora subsp. variegata]|uniref:Legume lectin domain-containing protein n=1 Tax=Corymbia citriodora subsp. variegata TaxID=360336 RepID=A0A8T0CNH8_CORYI|nr:hypothetical protein BT93_L1066 [Corymbia citriodora subsp. variegata]
MSFTFPVFDGRIVPRQHSALTPFRVQLTASDMDWNLHSSAGRAEYHKPMRLWDKSTGNVADFTTHFSFVINSEYNETYGDGLTFFLAPNGSNFPSKSCGGSVALVSADRDPSDPSTSFIALEFDTHSDKSWDPPCLHVGIDLNNISLVNYTCVDWFSQKFMTGGVINASITYNSGAQNLSVLMIDVADPKGNVAKLFPSVNLTKYLPDWVTIGFLATTGLSFEFDTLHSWNFSSNMRVIKNENRTKGSKSWVWSVIGRPFAVAHSCSRPCLVWSQVKEKNK